MVKAIEQFEMSRKKFFLIFDPISNGTSLDPDAHRNQVRSSKWSLQLKNESQQSKSNKGLLEQAWTSEKKTMELNFKKENCSWLTAKVSQRDYFVWSENEFQDSMALRYRFTSNKPPLNITAVVISMFSMPSFAKKRGLITQKHNEVRGLLGDLSWLAWSYTLKRTNNS